MPSKRPPYLLKAIENGGEQLGIAIRTARKRRAMTLDDMAEKIGVTRRTLIRLEKGDTKVNTATLLACLAVYGLLDQFTASVAPEQDPKGAEKERLRLPERIRKQRKTDDIDMSKL